MTRALRDMRTLEGEGTGGSGGTPSAGTGDGGTSATTSGAPPARPDYLPEPYWDAEKGAVKADDLTRDFGELNTLRDFKRQQDERASALPKSPDEIKLELPADIKLPQGMEFRIDDQSEAAKEFRVAAHEAGLDQAGASRLLSVYAKYQAEQMAKAQQADEAFFTAEKAKLGTDADKQIQAADAWLKANASAEVYAALSAAVTNAAAVQWIHDIAKRLNTTVDTGGGTGGAAVRDPAEVLYGKTTQGRAN